MNSAEQKLAIVKKLEEEGRGDLVKEQEPAPLHLVKEDEVVLKNGQVVKRSDVCFHLEQREQFLVAADNTFYMRGISGNLMRVASMTKEARKKMKKERAAHWRNIRQQNTQHAEEQMKETLQQPTGSQALDNFGGSTAPALKKTADPAPEKLTAETAPKSEQLQEKP